MTARREVDNIIHPLCDDDEGTWRWEDELLLIHSHVVNPTSVLGLAENQVKIDPRNEIFGGEFGSPNRFSVAGSACHLHSGAKRDLVYVSLSSLGARKSGQN